MRKIRVYGMILVLALVCAGCGKREEELAEIETAETAIKESKEGEESAEEIYEGVKSMAEEERKAHEALIVRGDDPITDEELDALPDDYFEPESAELTEAVEEQARLEEEYTFEVRNLQDIGGINYLMYEDFYRMLYHLLRREHKTQWGVEDWHDITYFEIVTDSIQENDAGVRFNIVPEGFDEEYDIQISYKYEDGIFNPSHVYTYTS